MKNTTTIVKSGYWYYDNEVKKNIQICKQNWDFYFEEEYDDGTPDLNEEGEAFYVIYDDYEDIRYANRSRTCLSLNEAIKLAESTIEIIYWD